MNLFTRLISKIFPLKRTSMYGSWQGRSSPFSGEAWDHDVFRATVDTIATHAAKGQVKHVVVDKNGHIARTVHNSEYSRLINLKPNPLMSGFEFKYRIFAQLETYTAALVYIKWKNAKPEMMLPIDYKAFEVYPMTGGGYAVKFNDFEGQEVWVNLEDCFIMRKFYNKRQASGDGNGPIYKVFDMSKASDEGFIECLTVSNKIRGLHKHKKAMLDGEDVKKSQDEFAERLEYASKNGGIVSLDSMEEYIPLNANTYSATSSQMREINNRIFTFMRTSEKIIQSAYSEQEGLAWYESVIEPLWEMFAEALTNACFTDKEVGYGNKLIITGGVLMGASYQTRVNIISQTKELGMFTINEQRELLGYDPIEGGDIRQVSLNFVNADNQSEYQTGHSDGDGGADDKGQKGDNDAD